MDKNPPTEAETLRKVLNELQSRLPTGWTLSSPGPVTRTGSRVEGITESFLSISAIDGRVADITIEIMRDGSPQATRASIQKLRELEPGTDFLILAPFLSRRSRELAEAEGVNYADVTGNVRVALTNPALFLHDHGADVNPFPGKGPERGLSGVAAGRIVLTLCDRILADEPLTLTEVAARSRVSLSYLSRIIALLERENLVERASRGPIMAVERSGLVRRWAEDYTLLSSNRGYLYLDPRGAAHTLDMMGTKAFQSTVFPFAVSGSFAAYRYAPISSPSRLVCFVDDPDMAAQSLDISPATGTGNVFILTPRDSTLYEWTTAWERDEWEVAVPCAPPAQIVADCLSGPDRMPEEGEALLSWLQSNRSSWQDLGGIEAP